MTMLKESQLMERNVSTRKRPNYHGAMLHHFHGQRHRPGQGSLSPADLDRIIVYLKLQYRILNAADYVEKIIDKSIEPDHICVTFDDALLCQYELAVPVLEKHRVKAFFFVHSSPFFGNLDTLEIYRYFRHAEYVSIDEFYSAFFDKSVAMFTSDVENALSSYDVSKDRIDFPFYTDNDKKFRFLRSMVLGKAKYDAVMQTLMDENKFRVDDVIGQLWMNNDHLRALDRAGHLIGLHSFSHPVSMNQLSAVEQEEEYARNFAHLADLLGKQPVAMSHPCGRYDENTLRLLERMGVLVGFRSSMSVPYAKSPLEIPREDHANIVIEMQR